jgi:glycosyltransferase involved in cell wall biosynthesis
VGPLHVRHLVRSDAFAGVERYLTYVAPELARRGHTVSVVGGRPAAMREALDRAGVGFEPARTTMAVVRAARRAPRPDVLHAHMTAAELAAVVASVGWRVPLVATLHFEGGRGHSWATRLAYRPLGARVDKEIAISRFVADSVGEHAVVIPLGIPAPAASDVATERRSIVLVGQRLEREKDTGLALQAWAASGLAAEGWQLHVAGRGALEGELHALGDQLGVDGSVVWLGHQADFASRLAEASILLAPAPREPFGLTVVEAMACALPVVAAAGGAHLETLGPASPETLFPPGDAAAAAADLRRLAADPIGRAEIGRAERARFDDEYRIDRHVDRLEVVYHEVVGSRPPG